MLLSLCLSVPGFFLAFLFPLFPFLLLFLVFLLFPACGRDAILPVQRDFRRFFLAGPADAVLEPAASSTRLTAVEVVADREVVRDPDQVVELVRVLVDVVELLLAVRPGDVLVGAEADPLVVLGWGEDRGGGAAARCCGRSPFRRLGVWFVAPVPFRRPPAASTSLVSTKDSKRQRPPGAQARGRGGRAPSSGRRCSCRLSPRPVRGSSARCRCSPPSSPVEVPGLMPGPRIRKGRWVAGS